jgi:hypothetical protein
VNGFLVVCLDSIDKRLLEHLDQDDGCTAPCFPRKATGVVHLLSVSAWVGRPLNACLKC